MYLFFVVVWDFDIECKTVPTPSLTAIIPIVLGTVTYLNYFEFIFGCEVRY